MPPCEYPARCTSRPVASRTRLTASATARTWSSRVRRIPPSSRSGAPKSTTQGSTPPAASAVTAERSGATSYTSAVTMRGGTRRIAGRPPDPSP